MKGLFVLSVVVAISAISFARSPTAPPGCTSPAGVYVAPGTEIPEGCQKSYCCPDGRYQIFPCDAPHPDCQKDPSSCCP